MEKIINIHFTNGEILHNCTVLEMNDKVFKVKDSQNSIVCIERRNVNYIVFTKNINNYCSSMVIDSDY